MSESQLRRSIEVANKTWITQLTGNERSTLVATFTGWMLDGMDVMVYSFVLPTLISLWHISKGEAGLLGTSALLLSSLGGWLAGLAADRYGRVKVLQLTILWFAFFTFLSGFANGFTQLLIFRGLQGLGFGGEWAVGSVLIGETIRSEYRGRAVGTVQGGWAVGWGISALFYTLLFAVLPPGLAWRAMFWVGLLPALLVVWIRSHVSESDIFEHSVAMKKTKSSAHFLQIFSPALLRTTLLASLVALGAQGGYHAITTWLPLYLTARGLSVTHTGGYLLVVIAGSFAGYLTAAHLADRIGRKWTLIQGKRPPGAKPLTGEDYFEKLPPVKYRIVAYDYGLKTNILRRLRQHGFQVRVLPATATAKEALASDPDGIFLSNGPGDPGVLTYAHQTVRELIGKKPIFGICLGHQILGYAPGGKTFKLKFGHRGGNQPVKDLTTGRISITSQNHGFAVDPDSLPAGEVETTQINLNDQTSEGLRHREYPIFSVQYHPEAAPGPHDANYFFREFGKMIENDSRTS